MQTTSEFIYTKNESKMICGIALCMMLIHHFWGFPTWLNEHNKCIYLLEFSHFNFELIIAVSCKLCVSIFAFNTGYVLYKMRQKFTFKNNIKRIFSFLISYWIICLLFLGVGGLFKEELPTFKELGLNLIGLDCGIQKYINVPFAWYVNFYILFILLSPIILFCTKGKNISRDVLFVCLWICLSQLCKNIENIIISDSLNQLFSVGLISLAAFFISKYNLFSKLYPFFSSNISINVLLAIVILVSRFYTSQLAFELTGHNLIAYQDCIYTPLFMLSVLSIIKSLKDNSKIITVLTKIGVLSMNIWFLHGIFYAGSGQFQWILYWPQYSIIILIWGLFVSYFLAVPISKLQSYVLSKIY